MRYNTIKWNDVANGEGICVSLFVQGCPHHCPNCFNPETWNYNEGKEFDHHIMEDILDGLIANNVQRNFSVLGGEPLCPENRDMVSQIIFFVRHTYPNIKIYVWTGYRYKDLLIENDPIIKDIFRDIDYLIDGPYIEEERDITLPMRGSRNQKIIDLRSYK